MKNNQFNFNCNCNFRIEKDCTNWAHDRIKDIFTSLSIEGFDFSVTKITSIQGDVSVNQRKGRVKQLFDLEITFEFSRDGGNVTGTGFVTEFTADYEIPSDLVLKLVPKLPEHENQILLKEIGKFAELFKAELYEIHGKPLLLEVTDPNLIKNEESTCTLESKSTIDNSLISNSAIPSSSAKSTISKPSTVSTSSSSSSTQVVSSTMTEIEDEVTFPCPVDQLYLMLTDASRIRAWSRSSASLPQLLLPQAPFSLFEGNISGKFITLQFPNFIEMEWKLKAWAKPSKVTISIRQEDEGFRSILTIKQIGVPNGEAEATKTNWHNYYWNPIKRAFGTIL